MYLTLAELRESKRTLMRNNVPGVRSQNGKYVVIMHPDIQFDLEADNNLTTIWKDAGERGMENQLFDAMFKDLPLGFRCFTTTNARIFASLGLSGADVYQTHVLGDESFATADFAALPARIITKERGSGGATTDPLDTVASVGWKASHVAVILAQANHVRIEHASRAKDAA